MKIEDLLRLENQRLTLPELALLAAGIASPKFEELSEVQMAQLTIDSASATGYSVAHFIFLDMLHSSLNRTKFPVGWEKGFEKKPTLEDLVFHPEIIFGEKASQVIELGKKMDLFSPEEWQEIADRAEVYDGEKWEKLAPLRKMALRTIVDAMPKHNTRTAEDLLIYLATAFSSAAEQLMLLPKVKKGEELFEKGKGSYIEAGVAIEHILYACLANLPEANSVLNLLPVNNTLSS